MKLERTQVESIGYEVLDFAGAELVASKPCPVAHGSCPVCGTAGGMTLGAILIRSQSGMQVPPIVHRCHIECVDWPTVPHGGWSDPDHGGEPICEECIEATGRSLDACPELPESGGGPCWMCEQIMREAQRDANARAFEAVMAREAAMLEVREEASCRSL